MRRVQGYAYVPPRDDDALMEAVYSRGTIAVSLDASQPTFRFYASGAQPPTANPQNGRPFLGPRTLAVNLPASSQYVPASRISTKESAPSYSAQECSRAGFMAGFRLAPGPLTCRMYGSESTEDCTLVAAWPSVLRAVGSTGMRVSESARHVISAFAACRDI